MASNTDLPTLVLDGVVRYTIVPSDSSGSGPILEAKWVSTRIIPSKQTGTGCAVRRAPGGGGSDAESAFTGAWTIEYYGPDGKLAVTPFLLDLEKQGEIYHGKWADPDGRPLLEGFGFEDDGKLYMRYGDRRV